MKKLLLVFSLIIGLTLPAFAQKAPKAEEIYNAKLKSMQEHLELTPEQLEKFAPVYKDYLTAVRNLPRPERKCKRDGNCDETCKMIVSRLEYKKGIITEQQKVVENLKDVLSPEQLKKFLKVESRIQHKIRNAKMRKARNK